ncbi:MAG: ABC transporter substrate-binding protein [Candidatus Nomurabacteria bacterium]|jgi:peptide/nickel transport system substrate-binding protein|nr:ABC transporter substrate-binding protein [Candidatus Nomurabacteria bacterium]
MVGIIKKTINKAVPKKQQRVVKKHFRQWVVRRAGRLVDVRKWILDWAAIVVALFLMIALQIGWYQNAYRVSGWAKGGSYSEATLGKVNSLNPLFATTASENTLRQLLFSSLYKYDASGNIKGDLASNIATEDGKHYEVTLRDDALWHDGEKVTVDDVIFTFELIKNQKVHAVMAESFRGITITKVDEQRVAFDLTSIYYGFAETLTFAILPEHILGQVNPENLSEQAFSSAPVGSGPFKFHLMQNGSGDEEEIIFLDNNKNYYGGSALLDRFVVYAFADMAAVERAVNNGSVDATASLGLKSKPAITNRSMINREVVVDSAAFAFLNLRSSVLGDINIRRAIQTGIDTASLRATLNDDNLLAQDFPFFNNDKFMDEELRSAVPKYDLIEAKKILTDNGYSYDQAGRLSKDGKAVVLKLATIDRGLLANATVQIASQLSGLGIQVQTEISSNNTATNSQQDFVQTVIAARDYDVLVYDIEIGAGGDVFPFYHSSQIGQTKMNLSNYSSKIMDDLLLSVRSSGNEDVRNAKRKSITKQWLNDAPAIGLYRSIASYWYSKNVRSFSENTRLVNQYSRFSDVLYWATSQRENNKTL